MTVHSSRTLVAKLGWKPGMGISLVTAIPPLEVSFGRPDGTGEGVDVIVGFVSRAEEVGRVANEALGLYRDGARLWLVYPKKGSAIATDMTRDKGWDGLPPDLLAVAQVAVDRNWSALRFRLRREIPKLTRASETRA